MKARFRRATLGTALALAMAAISACTPEAHTGGDAAAALPVQSVSACTGEVSRDWSAVGSQYYLIEATLSGDGCEGADATMRIRSREGALLYERAYPMSSLTLAFNVYNRINITGDLEAWSTNTAEVETADWLPAWPNGAAHPPGFQPAVTRNVYEAARGAQGPLFCYPDGGESSACVALAGDRATYLGSLTPQHI